MARKRRKQSCEGRGLASDLLRLAGPGESPPDSAGDPSEAVGVDYLAAIEVRSRELCEEAMDFVRRQMAANPGDSACEAFNEWTIQKLASLQVILEAMNMHLVTLSRLR